MLRTCVLSLTYTVTTQPAVRSRNVSTKYRANPSFVSPGVVLRLLSKKTSNYMLKLIPDSFAL